MLFGRRPPGRSALCGVHSDDEADGGGIPQALSDVLVCPLSKKRLRYCEASGSLVSDAVGVSFPIVAGLPCLVPKDGKSLEDHQEKSEECGLRDSSTVNGILIFEMVFTSTIVARINKTIDEIWEDFPGTGHGYSIKRGKKEEREQGKVPCKKRREQRKAGVPAEENSAQHPTTVAFHAICQLTERNITWIDISTCYAYLASTPAKLLLKLLSHGKSSPAFVLMKQHAGRLAQLTHLLGSGRQDRPCICARASN